MPSSRCLCRDLQADAQNASARSRKLTVRDIAWIRIAFFIIVYAENISSQDKRRCQKREQKEAEEKPHFSATILLSLKIMVYS